jgi:primosomal protein N' (replication factor Y)
VLQAVLHADPGRLVDDEWNRRVMLGDPPAATLAVVGGEAARAFVERLGRPSGVEVMGPDDSGRWLFRSDDQRVLLDALSAVERPPGRLRLWVDPARTG